MQETESLHLVIMLATNKTAAFWYRLMLGLIGWVAIILQYALMVSDNAAGTGHPLMEASLNFFSYYTVLTNLAVAVSMTILIISPDSGLGIWFARVGGQTALAGNMLVLSLIYHTILAQLWAPQGWNMVADQLLHTIVPILYLIYWVLFVPKGHLSWIAPVTWLLYPLLYLLYTLFRGSFVHWYPYPFVDVNKLGYDGVLQNSGILLFCFLLLLYLLVVLDRWMGRKTAH